LPEQKREAQDKRRMGLGVTGLANAGEALGFPYGSPGFLLFTGHVLSTLRDECYRASALLAAEKGPFPLYNKEKYLAGAFIQKLPTHVRQRIETHGLRNSHLTSIAPTGTISLCADNVSSGIEPVFALTTRRTVLTSEGQRDTVLTDYAFREWGVQGKTADECSIDDHLGVLLEAQKWVDSAVSKTCNVGANVSFEEFKQVYQRAWAGGAKGITTFRSAGKRFGILQAEPEASACRYDPETGSRTCDV
jgi:ribonucleoside-diphosphate reductase alpha chain